MRHTPTFALTIAIVTASALPRASADTITVGPGGDFSTIQQGLDAAGDYDRVVVENGTYRGPLNTNLDFHGARIELSAITPGAAVIDCEGSARAFLFDDGEDTLSVVDGFSVTNGFHSTGGGARIVDSSPMFLNCGFLSCAVDELGGAVRVLRGHPVFDSCTFTSNEAVDGGAIAVENGGIALRGSDMTSNAADDFGGALFLDESTAVVIDCTFSDNSVSTHYGDETAFGGAVRILGSQVELVGCVFESNVARRGGAVSLRRPSSVTIFDCAFYYNRSGGYYSSQTGRGAAIHMFGCSPVIDGCRFERNEPMGGGTVWGEYSSPTLTGCEFFNNKGKTGTQEIGHDVELYHTDIGDALIENCTFCGWRMRDRDDGALLRFGDCEPLVERTIISFYNHGPGVDCVGTGSPTIRECIVFGNVGGDEVCGDDPENNLSVDPLFCGFWDGNLNLCANSPALPGGNPWGALIGARGEGCSSCDTPVEQTSWGTIKAMYR